MTGPASPRRPCSTTHVFHYLRPGAPDGLAESIRRGGLQPLGWWLHRPRFVADPAQAADAFEKRYRELAEPLVGRDPDAGGVFFTTVDFRLLPGSALAGAARVAVPVDRLDPESSVLTYLWAGSREYHRIGHEPLRRAAELWTATHLRRWLAAAGGGWFFHMPQVVAYQPGGIPIGAGDLQAERRPPLRAVSDRPD